MANQVAYGFVGQEHLFADRVSTLDGQVIARMVAESAAMHSEITNQMGATMWEVTTDRTRKILLVDSHELQPLDEHGNPLPVRPSGNYDIGLPIQGAGTAWGDNRVSRAQLTVGEANRFTLEAQSADARWIKRHALAAVLDDSSWTFADPAGDVTVQPLANGDSVIYNRVGGTSSTDDHYLAQADDIADATNPYPTIYTELAEHPSNRGPFVAYISSTLVDDTVGLTSFVPVTDPDILVGNATDQLRGVIPAGPGTEVLGKAGKMWIVEWKDIPDGYIYAQARGNRVLAMRQYPEAELQGFFPEFNDVDGNHKEYRLLRYAGFGVQDRVAAVAYRIGNASYATPSGYSTPLDV